MRMPYQCMTRCSNVLVAARGSSIDSFSLEDGSLLSTWKPSPTQESQDGDAPREDVGVPNKVTAQNSESSSVRIDLDAASPPAKKRKISGSEPGPALSETNYGQKRQSNRSTAVASGLEAPAVIVLVSTTDGQHVIAVTGEDKSIRVFENVLKDGTHQLKLLSQRAMPKRPCTLAITNDNSTIISADKFGDVYALPLMPSEEAGKTKPETSEPTSSKAFVPAANELTIHSQRNRKALENQKRHASKAPEKSEPIFEHTLLLGHVSMLTDLALVTLDEKNYIITADRDEHIRISRGIPQTHIIEGFCLGHSEFITQLCVPENRLGTLISAGGDDEIFIWRWSSGKLISKTNLREHVDALKPKSNGGEAVDGSTQPIKIAVSGLFHTRAYVDDRLLDFIIVSCEGVPALFSFHLDLEEDKFRELQIVDLTGNPLAVVTGLQIGGSASGIVVSIDTVHQPGSTTELRSDFAAKESALLLFELKGGQLIRRDEVFSTPVEKDETLLPSIDTRGQLQTLFYNLENLRKRDGDGRDE